MWHRHRHSRLLDLWTICSVQKSICWHRRQQLYDLFHISCSWSRMRAASGCWTQKSNTGRILSSMDTTDKQQWYFVKSLPDLARVQVTVTFVLYVLEMISIVCVDHSHTCNRPNNGAGWEQFWFNFTELHHVRWRYRHTWWFLESVESFTIYINSKWNSDCTLVALRALATSRKASSCLSVRTEQLGSQWTDFHEIWYSSIFR